MTAEPVARTRILLGLALCLVVLVALVDSPKKHTAAPVDIEQTFHMAALRTSEARAPLESGGRPALMLSWASKSTFDQQFVGLGLWPREMQDAVQEKMLVVFDTQCERVVEVVTDKQVVRSIDWVMRGGRAADPPRIHLRAGEWLKMGDDGMGDDGGNGRTR